jgi:hypothetical protein
MTGPIDPFDLAYTDLLTELAELSLPERAQALELAIVADSIVIPFFGSDHLISPQGVIDHNGEAPTPAVGKVLLNYVLQNTGVPPMDSEKISFRDFKGAGPLVVSFANNTNHLIASTFAGRLEALEAACRGLGGQPATDGGSSDLFMRFAALPGVPQFLSFNDRDDDFPAQSYLLFQRSAESYLNLKSLFVLGTFLAGSLIKFHIRDQH